MQLYFILLEHAVEVVEEALHDFFVLAAFADLEEVVVGLWIAG